MYNIKGDNPTALYYQSLNDLLEKGDRVSPRGKLVNEIRPAAIELTNTYNRVTFLGGRRINPYFQVAESLWIMSGRADVTWLLQFNRNMGKFSDDGMWLNASYGERMRTWGKNALHNTIINPVDQLVDVYTKLRTDHDSRQAIIVLTNPSFDNANYTIGESGKDIACNLVLCFKIRNSKLEMTVFNRSNDLHWGVYGANLCQFTTIQEVLLNMLRHTDGLEDLEMGSYNQITDSLHIYLSDYGSKCTDDILSYYVENPDDPTDVDFTCVDEPRMSLSADGFDGFLRTYWSVIDPLVSSDDVISDAEQCDELVAMVRRLNQEGVIDDYWEFVIESMIVYRLFRLGHTERAVTGLAGLLDCQWKVSMMYFAKNFIRKLDGNALKSSISIYEEAASGISKSLVKQEYVGYLAKYLSLD